MIEYTDPIKIDDWIRETLKEMLRNPWVRESR